MLPLTPPQPPRPTLFPYTTLFRSHARLVAVDRSPRLPDLSRVPARLLEHERQHNQERDQQAGHDQDPAQIRRSEEHTSELQSLRHLVCRLLLEKKKKKIKKNTIHE